MLKSQIVPAGLDAFLFIPRMENGSVVPVAWSSIEQDWLAYADPRVRDDISRQFKNQWLAKGWVTADVGEVQQRPNTGKPTTTPPIVTTTPAQSGVVNGKNVTYVAYTCLLYTSPSPRD